MQFSFSAVQHADGSASGSFHHFYVSDGFTYDFWGTVTCGHLRRRRSPRLDRRGGAKVTSTDPDVGLFAGDDAWVRVPGQP